MTNPYAVLCIIGSCISLQVGAALAIQLFPHAGTWATASIRLLMAGLILTVIVRPKFHTWTRKQWFGVALLGASLGLMNGFFYNALSLIPLGTAVTIEFLGPLALAAFLSRSMRDAACVGLALLGMVLLGIDSFSGDSLSPLGVVFVLIAGAFWVGYILTTEGTGRRFTGQTGLALALVLGGVALAPLGLTTAPAAFLDPWVLGLGVVVAVLSSIIPYGIDMAALRVLSAGLFATLTALAPATAAIAGLVVLGQDLSVLSWTGLVVVVVAAGLALRESAVAS